MSIVNALKSLPGSALLSASGAEKRDGSCFRSKDGFFYKIDHKILRNDLEYYSMHSMNDISATIQRRVKVPLVGSLFTFYDF